MSIGNGAPTGGTGFRQDANGLLRIGRDLGADGETLAVINTGIAGKGIVLAGSNSLNSTGGTNNYTSTIFADGAATFAGDTTIGNSTDGTFLGAGSGTVVRRSIAPSATNAFLACYSTYNGANNRNIALFTNGSATFADNILSGARTVSTSYVEIFPTGAIVCRRDNANQDKNVWVGGYTNGTTYESTSYIKGDGDASFDGTVTATVVPPSDARFKENITPAKPQLADVVALGGLLKNYDWNADAPLNEDLRKQRQLGLIAQEAEVVCPGLVKTLTRTKQGKELTPAVVDSNGVVTTDATYEELDDSYKGLSTDVIIMKLLGAVAELKAEVDALRAASLR